MRARLCGLVLFCYASIANSQLPASAPTRVTDRIQTQASLPTPPATGTNRGTKDAPVFVQGVIETQRTAQQANWEHQQGIDKAAIDERMANYTGLAALFALGALLVAALQAGLFLRQLRLMNRTIADTKAAADAARVSAEAARAGNELSRTAYIADQRPWISMTLELAGPLVFDTKSWSEGRWRILLAYRLVHHGRSPATSVVFSAQILPFTGSHFPAAAVTERGLVGPPIPGTDVGKELAALGQVDEEWTRLKQGFGTVLFPRDVVDGRFEVSGDPHIFDAAKTQGAYSGQFIVLATVSYSSPLGDNHFRTAQAFHLFKAEQYGGKIDLGGPSVPAESLRLVKHPTQEGYIAT